MKPRAHTLVIGGTKGIGRTVARRLAEDGQRVSVVGRSDARPSRAAMIRTYAADVTDARALGAALATIVGDSGAVSAVVLSQRFRGDGDDWTRQVISRVQSDGTCWLSGTVWRGRTLMRISVCNWSTTAEDVRRSAAAILRAHQSGGRS